MSARPPESRPAGGRHRIPLAWRQLTGQKRHFYVAVCGVSFGTVLMLFQQGIYKAFGGGWTPP